jgi:choline dehydrogenase-like flavoprotein
MATLYDVCVIGSGPRGGVPAKELAERGAKVVLVEAGRKMRPAESTFMPGPTNFPIARQSMHGQKLRILPS